MTETGLLMQMEHRFCIFIIIVGRKTEHICWKSSLYVTVIVIYLYNFFVERCCFHIPHTV